MLDALVAASGGLLHGDTGPWLLHRIKSEDCQTDAALQQAIDRALRVCRNANLPDATYYEFDELDDGLYLARTGQWGAVDEIRRDFLLALDAHCATPPEPLGAASG